MFKEKVIFTKDECDSIIALADKFKPAYYFKQPEYLYNLSDQERKYFLDKFKVFDLIKFPRYIKILKYTKGIGFNLHKDSDGKDGRLKTVVTQLSTPDLYEGGTLQLKVNSSTHTVSKKVGNSVIYPASSLHEVSLIEKGVRYVMVFWLKKWNLNFSKSTI